MSRTKSFDSMSLLEKVDYIVKKQLPKEAKLEQTSLIVSYLLTVNVVTEDNPFELTTKTYEVIANYTDETVDLVIKDGDKVIKQTKLFLHQSEL